MVHDHAAGFRQHQRLNVLDNRLGGLKFLLPRRINPPKVLNFDWGHFAAHISAVDRSRVQRAVGDQTQRIRPRQPQLRERTGDELHLAAGALQQVGREIGFQQHAGQQRPVDAGVLDYDRFPVILQRRRVGEPGFFQQFLVKPAFVNPEMVLQRLQSHIAVKIALLLGGRRANQLGQIADIDRPRSVGVFGGISQQRRRHRIARRLRGRRRHRSGRCRSIGRQGRSRGNRRSRRRRRIVIIGSRPAAGGQQRRHQHKGQGKQQRGSHIRPPLAIELNEYITSSPFCK